MLRRTARLRLTRKTASRRIAMRRREFLIGMAAGAVAPWVATAARLPSAQAAQGGGQIVFSGFGADYEDNMRKYVIDPFQRQFNAKVVFDSQGSADEKAAKIRASQGQYIYDVAVLVDSDILALAPENLLQKVDPAIVPEMKNVYDKALTVGYGYGASVMFEPLVLVYNKEKVSPPPDSWNALWDPKYRGHVAISHADEGKGEFLLILAAMLGGGSEANVDPGFAKLRELVPNVGYWLRTSAQYIPYLDRGDVWLTPYWNGRAQVLKDQGMPIEAVLPKEGTLATDNIWAIPQSAKNKDLAAKFVNFYLQARQQSAWAEHMYYSPTNKTVVVPPKVASRIVYGASQVAKLHLPDAAVVARDRPGWIERWNKEVQKALDYAK